MVNPQVQGRVYTLDDPYHVSREKIREFARAVHATDSLHSDPAAAQAAGHRDVVAPPTFPVVISQRAEALVIEDPEAEVDFSRVVHVEQRFTSHRPIVAGDVLGAAVTVERVRPSSLGTLVNMVTAVTDSEGAPVCETFSSLLIRGEEEQK